MYLYKCVQLLQSSTCYSGTFHVLSHTSINKKRGKVNSHFIKVRVPTPSNWDEKSPGTMPSNHYLSLSLEEVKLIMTLTEDLKENTMPLFLFLNQQN